MIAHLSGTLLSKEPNSVIVDVGGVGYEVTIPVSTFYDLEEPGSNVKLRTYTHVREDALQLYGFASTDERELFDDLLEEARFAFSARDDHAVVGAVWTLGIVRRALLEAGARLPLDSPDQVFQLAPSEVAQALRS